MNLLRSSGSIQGSEARFNNYDQRSQRAGHFVLLNRHDTSINADTQERNIPTHKLAASQTTDFAVYTHQEIILGRNASKCHWHLTDPSISQKHLRLRCIPSQEGHVESRPLVLVNDLSRNGIYWNGKFIGQKPDVVILSDGDVLRLSFRISLCFKAATSAATSPLDAAQQEEMQLFRDDFIVTSSTIGFNRGSRIFLATKQATRTQVVCRIVNFHDDTHSTSDVLHRSNSSGKRTMTRSNISPLKETTQRVLNEIDILSSLDHPGVMGMEKVYLSPRALYMFQELVTPSNLVSHFQYRNERLLESEAAVIIKQILQALQYLHDQGILHQSLRPDNIMITTLGPGIRIVLTDFALARRIQPDRKPGRPMIANDNTTIETNSLKINHAQQEHRNSGFASDMWSVGLISAWLLTGSRLCYDFVTSYRNPKLVSAHVLQSLKSSDRFQKTNELPKLFLQKLLCSKHEDRMTAEEAVRHPWFTVEIQGLSTSEMNKSLLKIRHARTPILLLVELIGGKSSSAKSYINLSTILHRKPVRARVHRTPIDPPYKPVPKNVYKITLWPMNLEGSATGSGKDKSYANVKRSLEAAEESEYDHELVQEVFYALPVSPVGKRLSGGNRSNRQVSAREKLGKPPVLSRSQSFRVSKAGRLHPALMSKAARGPPYRSKPLVIGNSAKDELQRRG